MVPLFDSNFFLKCEQKYHCNYVLYIFDVVCFFLLYIELITIWGI